MRAFVNVFFPGSLYIVLETNFFYLLGQILN